MLRQAAIPAVLPGLDHPWINTGVGNQLIGVHKTTDIADLGT